MRMSHHLERRHQQGKRCSKEPTGWRSSIPLSCKGFRGGRGPRRWRVVTKSRHEPRGRRLPRVASFPLGHTSRPCLHRSGGDAVAGGPHGTARTPSVVHGSLPGGSEFGSEFVDRKPWTRRRCAGRRGGRSELVREGVNQPSGVHVDLREKRPAIQEIPHEHVARRPDSVIDAHGELEFRH